MKKLLLFIILLGGIISCGGNANKTIPISDMEKITTEMFLVNAYCDLKSIAMKDSIDVYEPIFNKYGYTSTDMLHTIKELTKRKSVRYSDILDAVIKNIDDEFKRLNAIIINQDTIDTRILRYYTRNVYAFDSVVVTKMKDTADLRLTIPLEDSGDYAVTFKYFIDSLDKNRSIVYKYGVLDTANNYRSLATRHMTKLEDRVETFKLPNIEDKDSALVLHLAVYAVTSTFDPHVRIDSIRVDYTPSLELAKDSFIRDMINIQELFDRYYVNIKEDSCALCVDSTGLEIQVDSLPEL